MTRLNVEAAPWKKHKEYINLRCDLNPGLPYTITTPREEERVQITQQVKVSVEEESKR